MVSGIVSDYSYSNDVATPDWTVTDNMGNTSIEPSWSPEPMSWTSEPISWNNDLATPEPDNYVMDWNRLDSSSASDLGISDIVSDNSWNNDVATQNWNATPGPWADGYVYGDESSGGDIWGGSGDVSTIDLSNITVGNGGWYTTHDPFGNNAPSDPYGFGDLQISTPVEYSSMSSMPMAIDLSQPQTFDPAYDDINFTSLTLPQNTYIAPDPYSPSNYNRDPWSPAALATDPYDYYQAPVDTSVNESYSPYVSLPRQNDLLSYLPSWEDYPNTSPQEYAGILTEGTPSILSNTSFDYQPPASVFTSNEINRRATDNFFAPGLQLSNSLNASDFQDVYREDDLRNYTASYYSPDYNSGCASLVAGAGGYCGGSPDYSFIDPNVGAHSRIDGTVYDPNSSTVYSDPNPGYVMAIEDQVQDEELENPSYELCYAPKAYFITSDIMIFKETDDDKCKVLDQVIAKQSQEENGFWLIRNGINDMYLITDVTLDNDEQWILMKVAISKKGESPFSIVQMTGDENPTGLENGLYSILDSLEKDHPLMAKEIASVQCNLLHDNNSDDQYLCGLFNKYNEKFKDIFVSKLVNQKVASEVAKRKQRIKMSLLAEQESNSTDNSATTDISPK